MHYERLGRAKRFTGAAVERRVVATKQPLGLENYQWVSSPGGSCWAVPSSNSDPQAGTPFGVSCSLPRDQPHSGTTRTTTAAGWGQTGGRRRLWPPRRGCQCPRFGHLRASGEAGRLHGAQRPHRAGVSARGLWSRTRVSFGTCTAGRQPRQLDHSSQRGDRDVMTFNDPGWSCLSVRTPRALDREECRRLLGSTKSAVGYCTDFGPRTCW